MAGLACRPGHCHSPLLGLFGNAPRILYSDKLLARGRLAGAPDSLWPALDCRPACDSPRTPGRMAEIAVVNAALECCLVLLHRDLGIQRPLGEAADHARGLRPDPACTDLQRSGPRSQDSEPGRHCRGGAARRRLPPGVQPCRSSRRSGRGRVVLPIRRRVLPGQSLPDSRFRAVASTGQELSDHCRPCPTIAVGKGDSCHLGASDVTAPGLQPLIDRQGEGIDSFREIASVQRFESELLRRLVEGAPDTIVLAGDFNLTAEHPLFCRDWSDYRDAFAWTSWGLGHTMFTRLIGLRIDHILCGPAWRPRRCVVGPDVGSAHLPVVADLVESP